MNSDYEKLGVFYLGREADAATGKTHPEPLLIEARDLTTHAVCVGMTGSGKTGLCIGLLEEAAIDGIPAICIDPKGDIADLLLTFPKLAPADFAPWVDPADAARRNLSTDELAAQTAASWQQGLAEWDQAPERIQRLRDAVEVSVYTPGAGSGLGLSVLRSLAHPGAAAMADPAALAEQIGGQVAALLALLGRDPDPVQSRDYILLARLIEHSWQAGEGLDLAGLIQAIQKPGFDRLGAFDLETYYPAKQRLELAMAVNSLLASPGFAAWTLGEPLDAQRLLYTSAGKPRISIISIAHLSDSERMFIVTLVLNELVAWMRRQSGTSSLRALFYMDEIFGYFPPTANPPAKLPMLTLLKQARAFGLGCVLATQNPVDLDYRGLANAGTWLIGRLQTERDKLRVIEGLTSALGGAAPDRDTLQKLMSSLTQRLFLMRRAKDDAPRLIKSRWTLSYLRGPLNAGEIGTLMAPQRAARAAAIAAALAATPGAGGTGVASAATTNGAAGGPGPGGAASRPALPAQVRELFLPAATGSGPIQYRLALLASAKLHYVEPRYGLDAWQTLQQLLPVDDEASEPLWAEARDATALRAQGGTMPAPGASYAVPPTRALRAESYAAWSKAYAAHLYESARASLFYCEALKLASTPGESEGDFRVRLGQQLREQRDAQIDALGRSQAPKLAALQDRLQRAQARATREHSQATQQTLQTAVAVGSTILGALLGRRAVTATTVSRAATALRTATRIGQEREDAAQADESVASVQQALAQLEEESAGAISALKARLDPAAIILQGVQVPARKSDISIGELAVAWVPWRTGNDGFPAPAC
jgi:hypothetical protein